MENKSGVGLIVLLFLVIFLIGLMYACEANPPPVDPAPAPQPYVEPEPAPGEEPAPAPAPASPPAPAPEPAPAPAPDVQYDDELCIDVLPDTGGMELRYEG